MLDFTAFDGTNFQFYDCINILTEVAKHADKQGLKILAIIDGPPEATGPFARYPAGPILCSLFKDAQVDLLLDDYIRKDEKEIVKRWRAELSIANQPFAAVERSFEKEACPISVRPSTRED